MRRIYTRLRLKRLTRKWLYREAIKDLVPAPALERKKHPFATPYDDWLRASLGQEVARRYAPNTELAEILNSNVVNRLVTEHGSGRADHKRILYSLLEFAHWHSCFVEQSNTIAAVT